MKRLDLLLGERELGPICAALRTAGAPGYSVMRHVTGVGKGGEVQESMEMSGYGANAHVIVFCEAEVLEQIRAALLPLLNYYGGVGFVSDAQPL
ncbi:transcriptional regulator [Synechococcus sp. CCY9201]|uniref:P-II family nitrogen regulator n=1 Tax=Synechococcus sp. CCY9201 TaxID=174697 RepID=UPI002B20B154|nr:transcriptional regulator [Synechococcus sp. CCY9201]MEA5475589.1 transcriptional regulator [Synechococcus sp. CCY9201]